jgi:hypothetical protein
MFVLCAGENGEKDQREHRAELLGHPGHARINEHVADG